MIGVATTEQLDFGVSFGNLFARPLTPPVGPVADPFVESLDRLFPARDPGPALDLDPLDLEPEFVALLLTSCWRNCTDSCIDLLLRDSYTELKRTS